MLARIGCKTVIMMAPTIVGYLLTAKIHASTCAVDAQVKELLPNLISIQNGACTKHKFCDEFFYRIERTRYLHDNRLYYMAHRTFRLWQEHHRASPRATSQRAWRQGRDTRR